MTNAILGAKFLNDPMMLIGKVLVAKKSFSEWVGNSYMDIKIGTTVYVLTVGSPMSPHNSWRKNQQFAKYMFNGMRGEVDISTLDDNWAVIEPDDRLKGKAIVITGALTNTREYYKTLIEVMGGVFGSAITSKTAYLVVGDTTFQGDPNHKSTKAKKAAALGIPVISESGLIAIINKGA